VWSTILAFNFFIIIYICVSPYRCFLRNSTLTETVYCRQPTGFVDSARPDLVCRLNRSMYGLKQAPRAWYSRFASYLASIGFVEAKSNTSLFIYRRGDKTVYLLLYGEGTIHPPPTFYSARSAPFSGSSR
jgi:hypothetical protein